MSIEAFCLRDKPCLEGDSSNLLFSLTCHTIILCRMGLLPLPISNVRLFSKSQEATDHRVLSVETPCLYLEETSFTQGFSGVC